MSKNPPDWWARSFGIIGILIALGGLTATYFNNRWQRQVYEKSLEERIYVQLSAGYDFSVLRSKRTKDPPKGQLAIEVVNLGLQPMYLKSIAGTVAGQRVSFYYHDPLDAKEPMRRIEPGEAADYKIDWGSSLEDMGIAKGKGIIEVETTKKFFSQPVQVNRITVSEVLSLLKLIPPEKLTPPSGQQ